ncbi:hypothetical protein BASA83_013038 [Batrachochytrium salamandrivorans]|nr:hypothetical protein BASA83_013038 [Batrachochytrium salamandrivorans]
MPYGLQSDEDSQLASILERLQLLEAENASLKQSISQAQSQAQSQPQEAPQHIAPPLPQYRQEPSVSLPDKFNGNRLKLRTFLNQLELVFLINPADTTQRESRPDLDWNEAALIHRFRVGLSAQVKNMLLHHEYPKTLEEFALLAIKVDARIQEHHLETQITWTRDHTQRQRTIPPHPQQNRYQQTPSQRLPPVSAPTNPMMMDLDATRRGPITPQERDRRFQGKLCFRCGKEGHFRAECPLGARRQVSAVSTLTEVPRPSPLASRKTTTANKGRRPLID